MNTIDSSATVRARIGLVELPELAGMLQNAGLQTITGPSFREAATAIKEGFAESTFPILVADASTAGLRAWIQRIHNTAAAAGKPVHIAVLRGEGDPVIVSENIVELHTPLPLNRILAAVKIAPVPGGDALYPAPAAAPVSAGIDFDFDFDELEAEDVAPAPAATAAAAPPWEAPTQAPAAQQLPWEAPAPAAAAPSAEIDWSTPAPAASAAPAAPVQGDDFDWNAPAAPVPSAPQAPVEDFDWNTPSAAAPVDEFDWDTPATPAAPVAAAPVQGDEFDWNTPAAVAPSAPEAPVEEFDWNTPAPAQTAPVAEYSWEEPAAPAAQPAPAAVAEFSWSEPAAPAAAAPEAPSAAPEAEEDWASAFPTAEPAVDWGTPAAPEVPAVQAATEWDDAFPTSSPAVDWAAASPAEPAATPAPVAEPAAIDWGTPAAAAEPAPIDWGMPAPAAADPAEPAAIDWGTPPTAAAEPAPIDWGAPAAAPVPETDRPEPGPDARTFTPAPPAAAQAPVPAPVTPVQAQPVYQQQAPAWTGHTADPFRDQPAHQQGDLIVSYSGKGGVGKSTSSLRLATIAADAGLKVILIDGNAAQGDLRTYMKLHRSNLPTIYDAALGDVPKAVLRPDLINENRESTLGKVNFAFVAAAPDEIYNKDIVTDAVYGQVIDYCRRHADLVILDTQIVEAADRSGVVDDIILPALVQDGWGIGISDMSSPGVNNLNHRLHKFIQNGVPSERLMVLLNRVPEDQMSSARKASEYFRGRAKFLGVIEDDFQISRDMNAGRMQVANRNLNAALSEALYTITGNEAFTGKQDDDVEEPRSIFKRLLGRKKEVAA